MPILIPYFINMCYFVNGCNQHIKNIVGCATKVNLNYKILEDIAEQMVYSTSEKVQSIYEYCEISNKEIEALYFENNRWNAFEIDNTILIIIYTEKYNKYYVQSEEECDNDNNETNTIMSYSHENQNNFLNHDFEDLMNLHNNAKEKIYETHMFLCFEENEDNIKNIQYISSSEDSPNE